MPQSIVAAVLANPESDEPRLYYAEHLQKSGELAKAKFITAQCRMARLVPHELDWYRCKKIVRDLFSQHRSLWADELGESAQSIEYERGLPTVWTCSPRGFLNHADDVFTAAPITTLRLIDVGAGSVRDIVAWFSANQWNGLRRLELIRATNDLWAPFFSLDCWAQLRELHFADCATPDHGGLVDALVRSTSLASVESLWFDLGMTDLSVEILAANSPMTSLKKLGIVNCAIGDAGARVLARSMRMKSLAELNLSMNRIGHEGIRELARSSRLTNLKSFAIRQSDISPDAAEALSQSVSFAGLEELDLTDCEFDLTSMRYLCSISSHLTNLTRLFLGRTACGIGGAQLLSHAPFVPTLKQLDLQSATIGDDGLRGLLTGERWGALETLDLSNNDLSFEALSLLSKTENLPELKHIELSNQSFSSHLGALRVSDISKSLTRVGLNSCELNDTDLAELVQTGGVGGVIELSLYWNPIGDDAISVLCEASLPNLRNLNVGGSRITGLGVDTLMKSALATQLVELGMDARSDDVITAARLAGELGDKSLTLRGKSTTNKQIEELCASQTLEAIERLVILNARFDETALELLASAPSLKNVSSLSIMASRVTDGGVKTIATARYWESLRSLSLANNRISDDGAKSLADASYLAGLRALQIQQNKIGAAGVSALLSSADSLENIELWGNPLGPDGVAVLADFVSLRNVASFSFCQCELGEKGAAALGAQRLFGALESLDLSDNRFGNAGVDALRIPFVSCERLVLRKNGITRKGVRSLLGSGVLNHIRELDLRDNPLDATSVSMLQDACGSLRVRLLFD